MSILGRFSNLIKSNLNAAVDKLSDPAKEVDLLIEEMEEELKKLRLELRDQLGLAAGGLEELRAHDADADAGADGAQADDDADAERRVGLDEGEELSHCFSFRRYGC